MPKGNKKIARTATEALQILWASGFFRAWKKLGDIDARLAKDDYHFSTPELGMALMRGKYLTRRGGKGKYEYIQKHPFIHEEK